jgi:hypothetical protein
MIRFWLCSILGFLGILVGHAHALDFQDPIVITESSTIRSLVTGDFDHDGFQDIAGVLGEDSVRIYFFLPDGTYDSRSYH